MQQKREDQHLCGLFEAISSLPDVRAVEAFFRDLCTPKELVKMIERWRVCQLLARRDLSYREIHKITGISLATITRVARFLNEDKSVGYVQLLGLISKEKKNE